MKYICWYVAPNGSFLYVSHLPGDGGVDWGYCFHSAGAKLLTRAQARRWQCETSSAGRCMRPML